jgi:hypothetical protein
MTAQHSSSPVNLFIGISLLVFAAMVAWFVFKILLGLAPIIGGLIAIAGGIWYFQAETDQEKLRAMQTLVAGIGISIVFSVLF